MSVLVVDLCLCLVMVVGLREEYGDRSVMG